MARPTRGVAATVDTNLANTDRFSPISPQTFGQTVSPVGSLIATPAVSPEAAYIAAREAGQILTREVLLEFHQVEDADLAGMHESSLSQISDSALVTVNLFLDRILHNILASSRSLSLANLRNAVKEVLKPRLAAEAIGGADEELIECIGEDEEIDLFEDVLEIMDGSFDLDLVWKRARLRCMVYTRLGDLEEDDEERYIEEYSLDGYIDGRRMSRNNGLVSPPVAIWLTAILEFIGENALMISCHSAYRRGENKYGRGLAGQPLHPSVVTVGDGDLEKIALNPTLGRLWRAWRKPLKSPRPSISRALSVESMQHRRGDSKSSVGFGRKTSSETLSSLREPVQEQDPEYIGQSVRKDSLAEEPEAEDEEEERNVASQEIEPAAIPLPESEYDVAEIEVPGYTADLHLEGRREHLFVKSKRPTSIALPGSSRPTSISETSPSRGPRHMRSQSLPVARRPSAYALFEGNRRNVAKVLESNQAEHAQRSSVAERPVSEVSQAEVFESLQSPADYQTPTTAKPESQSKPVRRTKGTFVPPADRKSGVSEFGGSDGPVLFDRSDYRVDPNEIPAVPTVLSPQITAATPTDMPGTPVDPPVRSGLRSNRPVSLAMGSPDKLAAPERTTAGDVSPVAEGEYLASGEVSPLDPSDDEGSVSIAGLKDAKEYMGVDPSGHSGPDSGDSYQDAPEEAAVSPISPPVAPPSHTARTWIQPSAPQLHREIPPVAVTPVSASRQKNDEPMARQTSDERRREAAAVPQIRSLEKDRLPDIPKEEQIKALAAAAHTHKHVKDIQPARISRSMSKDMPNEGIHQAFTAATNMKPLATPSTLNVPVAASPQKVPSPEPSPVPVLETATKIHVYRKEVPADSKFQTSDSRPQLPVQDSRNQYQDTRNQPEPKSQNFGGITPLQLKDTHGGDSPISPPISKLLERRRQLPQVDTATPEKASVQRLASSPQSPDSGSKQLPARSVPEQVYSPPVLPPVPRETTPPVLRRSASRKTSKSGDDAFGQKSTKSRNSSNERAKDFDQLIVSDETLQYTLTPQNIRSYQVEATSEVVPMQKSNSRDRPRGLSFGQKSRSNIQTAVAAAAAPAPAAAAAATAPSFVGIPVRRPPGATPSSIMFQSKKSGLAPREAKADMTSIRDFADFMRTTGPTDSGDLNALPQKVVRGPKPVRNTDIQAKPQTAGLPVGMRNPSSPTTSEMRPPGTSATSGSRRKGPKLIARDAQTNDEGTSELIDFIRSGPPGEPGAHRIPRTVAPFRTTMDSDDMKAGLAAHSNGHNYGRYAPSITNSTQESLKTASGLSSSNSHTGLLASARANANIPSAMGGVQEEGIMPVRKSRKPRDPYAIDVSDDEEDDNEDRMGTPRGGHRREESLVEFLQSQLPPANTARLSSLGRPIGTGPGMARPKPQARAAAGAGRSDTNDLANFLKNSGPPGGNISHSTNISVGSIAKEKKGGLGGMFRRRG